MTIKLIPFSLFIDNIFYEQGIKKLPPLLDLVIPELFKDELESK